MKITPEFIASLGLSVQELIDRIVGQSKPWPEWPANWRVPTKN
jgi:hypothetical protein